MSTNTLLEIAVTEVPNMDGTFPDELEAIWAQWNAVRVLCDKVCHYADSKKKAMLRREVGDINEAVRLECICDRVYKELPEAARW